MNSSIKRPLHALVVLFLLTININCSVRYVPRRPGFQPGYVDTQLGENTFQVKIGEAWPKDWADLEKFAVYRAAEITQSKGLRYFSILSASSYTNNYEIKTPTISTTNGTATRIGSTVYINTTTTTTPSTSSTISGGWYILEFKVLTDEEAVSAPRLVDSMEVIKSLKFFIENRK